MTTRGLLVCLAAAWAIAGCDNQPHRTVVITAPPQQQVTVTAPQAPTTIMNSSDLDLATISDLLRSGRISDAETLQATINNPQNALNNVDLDHDGAIDPITVNEGQNPSGKQFNLTANPASQPAVVVANINVNVTGGQAVVQAGYPSYVAGYDRDYYNYSVARDVAFMAWALSPRPMFIARPYASYGWYSTPSRVFAPEVVTQRRTEYATRTHVSPVQRSAPPPTFTQQAQATKVPSGFQPSAAARPAPTTNNLNDRAVAQDFRARDTAQPVARATGFGARPSDPSVGSPPPTQRSTTSSFAGSTPAAASPPPAAARPSPPPPSSPPPSRPSFNSTPAPGPRTSPGSSPPTSFRPSFNSSSPGPRTSPSRR